MTPAHQQWVGELSINDDRKLSPEIRNMRIQASETHSRCLWCLSPLWRDHENLRFPGIIYHTLGADSEEQVRQINISLWISQAWQFRMKEGRELSKCKEAIWHFWLGITALCQNHHQRTLLALSCSSHPFDCKTIGEEVFSGCGSHFLWVGPVAPTAPGLELQVPRSVGNGDLGGQV